MLNCNNTKRNEYIRTNEGIYSWDCPIEALMKATIIKRADNIQDLCDVFVYENEKGNKIVEKILTFGSFMYATGEYEFKYGAIWNDKGLIYVAKINDKGELELL